MQMTKKVLSVVLAVLMVVSMMSVMAVTASAAEYDPWGVYDTRSTLNQGDTISGYYIPAQEDEGDCGDFFTIKDADTNAVICGRTSGSWTADKNYEIVSKDYDNTYDSVNEYVFTVREVENWTFKLNSNFSGEWNADTDVVSEQPVELNLAEGNYEFQIVAYKNGNISAYRGNVQAGSSTETYSQTMYDHGGNAQFHADGGKYTLTYNAGTGVLTINPVYVAKIGSTNYKTLEAAFAAAADGDTITLLADCAGNGIKAPQGKFATGLTVDFAGHTYTVDGETVGSTGTETNGFQLLKGNKITFENGTITSTKAKILVQNYSDLTLDKMTLTLNNPDYTSAYTLSNNNGEVVIDDTTINANPAGGFAFDVCRYASYPSVSVTVTGNSTINGNVEVFASKGDAKDGFSLTLESGTMTGDIVVDATAQALVGNDNKITKAAAFTQTAPAGYEWVDNGDGTSSLSHVHDWDYENVTWTFTENATTHSIYAKYTLTCKTDPTHTKEQTGSGTSMVTVAVDGDKFVYSHSAVKIDGNTVAVPNYTRNVADGIINRSELVAASKVAGEYKLANDITGFYDNVKPVDGFVLDGQNHMIKYGTMNASGRVMFVAADQNTKFTLKNITLDGNNRAKWAVCAYTGNSGNNAGNVITLDTVTIQNFKSTDYVGAINAFGSSTWNLKDCTITGNTTVDDSDGLSGSAVWAGSKATINIDGGTYDEVYLHSYSGTGAVLNADGGATINNLVLDLTKTDTLKANIDDATVGAITANDGTIPEEAVVMDPANATVAAPEGYKWVDSDETGMKTLAQIVYVAQIGSTKFESLEAAFAAAQDGDTITLLADCEGNGIIVPQGKFATGLTVDFGGHTYTVSGTPVGSSGTESIGFQLLKGNNITFQNGTITADCRVNPRDGKYLQRMIQNYSNLTLDNMTVSMIGQYYDQATISTCNGATVINNSTVSAPDFTWLGYNKSSDVGGVALTMGTFASYPSIDVTVTGGSTIDGDIKVSDDNNKKAFSLSLESGTMSGNIVLDETAKAAIDESAATASVKKADEFNQAAPNGYKWVETETAGVYKVAPFTLQDYVDETFGNIADFTFADESADMDGISANSASLVGVQIRRLPLDTEDEEFSYDEEGNKEAGLRFVATMSKALYEKYENAAGFDYGFEINGHQFSCKDSVNNVALGHEDIRTASDYAVMTLALKGFNDSNKGTNLTVKFFVKTAADGTVYADYAKAGSTAKSFTTTYNQVEEALG